MQDLSEWGSAMPTSFLRPAVLLYLSDDVVADLVPSMFLFLVESELIELTGCRLLPQPSQVSAMSMSLIIRSS